MADGIPFRNDSRQEVPAFGILRATGWTLVDARYVLTADQPNGDFQRFYYINDAVTVPAGSSSQPTYGLCSSGLDGFPSLALLNAQGGQLPADMSAPLLTQGTYGVRKGQWALDTAGGYGFTAVTPGPESISGFRPSFQALAGNGPALVRQDRVDNILVKLTDNLDDGEFTEAGVWYVVGDQPGNLADTGQTVRVGFNLDLDRGGGPGTLLPGLYVAAWFANCWLIVNGDSLTDTRAVGPPADEGGGG